MPDQSVYVNRIFKAFDNSRTTQAYVVWHIQQLIVILQISSDAGLDDFIGHAVAFVTTGTNLQPTLQQLQVASSRRIPGDEIARHLQLAATLSLAAIITLANAWGL